ncbi:MAG: FapA family protein [Planctomycetota bacterium]|nr:FapA family protein [Planctomycetota bacterium]
MPRGVGEKEPDSHIACRDGETLPVLTAYSIKSGAMAIHIITTLDRMRAFIQLIPGKSYVPINTQMIQGLLNSAGIINGIDQPGLEFFVNCQNSPRPLVTFVELATGTPVRHGKDSTLEFHVQPSGSAHYDTTVEGNIDFKQLNILENCFVGQLLATMVPPGVGKDGRDVYGEVVPSRTGVTNPVAIGMGVALSENGHDYTASIEGRLIYDNQTLSVSSVLEIGHDIDYRIGNIDFVGKVVVNGSLLDGFSIKAKRGVELKGDMGSASIVSEGDVRVVGGIKGKGSATISCRNFSARFIENATITASGTVKVEKDVLQSVIKCQGRVSVIGGSVIGGEIWALAGMEVATSGSELGVATNLIVGLNWADENRHAAIKECAQAYTAQVDESKEYLTTLLASEGVVLNAEEKGILSELIGELRYIRDGISQLEEEMETWSGRMLTGRVSQINILKEIYPGSSVRFGEGGRELDKPQKGPLSIIPEQNGVGFKSVSLKKLPVPVDVAPAEVKDAEPVSQEK